jgi:aryl-alcohol dehydrogenase-like predicted oxidoreductase
LSEGVETLAELKHNGRIGGISAGIYDLALWKRVLRDAPLDAALIHNHYCLNDTTLLELLPVCEKRRIGVINGSPFASGLLTERGAPAWHPARIADRKVFKEAAAYCEEHGTTISKVALQFAVGNPRVPTTLFSTSRTEDVERNLRWYGEPADPELTREVQRILALVMDKQWDYSLKPEQQT